MARRSAGRRIDFKQWTEMSGQSTTISSDITTLLGTPLDFLEPGTILRCRGAVQAGFDATVQVNDEIDLTFGLGIISTNASNGAVAGMPGPAGQVSFPWLWWGTIHLKSTLASGVPGSGSGSGFWRLDIDTKAMRKIKPFESLVMLCQSEASAGAPVTSLVLHNMRILIGT